MVRQKKIAWKKIEKKNPMIALNMLYAKNKKNMSYPISKRYSKCEKRSSFNNPRYKNGIIFYYYYEE